MVLVAMVVLGILVEVGVTTQSHISRREQEQELLFRGQAYRNAIRSYYEAGKPVKKYPPALDDLVKDPRSAFRRHLRVLYSDPMIRGKAEWVLIRAPDGGIMGVASSSTDRPLRTGNFPDGLEQFETAKSYGEWVFAYTPIQALTGSPTAPPSGSVNTPVPPTR